MSYDLDKLERLEKAATPGPWEFDGDYERVYPKGSEIEICHLIEDANGYDGELIATARNALPEMIANLREARELLREVEWSAELPCENEAQLKMGMKTVPACPRCGNPRSKSHAPDCRLKAALERQGRRESSASRNTVPPVDTRRCPGDPL